MQPPRDVMGVGHLSQPSRTLADAPMKPRARPLQLMRHATTSHVAAAITDPKKKTMLMGHPPKRLGDVTKPPSRGVLN
jgi:hypothetical protein